MTLYGFLNCNKPPGMTSRDVVNVVQRRLRKVKVGHAGTLDPLAQGVLVLAVGPASRLVPCVQQLPKFYRATFRLAASTVSGDLEGEVTDYPDLPIPSRAEIEAAATRLVGTIEQTPPAHSAIWVDGRRAYKRIRAGEVFEMPKRMVEVRRIETLRYEFPELELEIECGSGTYIRSIGLDLARAAGSIAVMSRLCRLAVGCFRLADAVSIDQLRDQDLACLLVPAVRAVEHLPHLVVDAAGAERLGHGLCIEGEPRGCCRSEAGEVAAIGPGGELRALLQRRAGQWCPKRVFPIDP